MRIRTIADAQPLEGTADVQCPLFARAIIFAMILTGCGGAPTTLRHPTASNGAPHDPPRDTAPSSREQRAPDAPSTAPVSRLVLAELSPEDQGAVEKLPGHSPGGTARAFGWIVLSIGADATVGAVITSFILLHQKGVLDENCNAEKRCSSAGVDAAATIHALVPWNTAMWVVAAAGIGTGAVLLLTHRPQKAPSDAKDTARSAKPPPPELVLSPSPSGASFSLVGTF
jgi:hypothetical protein